MLQKIKFLFIKRTQTRNLSTAYQMVSDLQNQFGDIAHYIYGDKIDRFILKVEGSIIPDHLPSRQELDFLRKLDFALASYKDELQIALNNQRDKEKMNGRK